MVKGVEAMGGGGGWMLRGGFISCCSSSSSCVSGWESAWRLLLGCSGDNGGDGRLPSGDSGMTETGLSKESGANRAGARGGSCGRLFSSWTVSFLSW